ncbi:MAG TPA: hypothetical protein VFX49_12240 [Chloroflexota bacterium]|nr:hypothetical protein [Chloroflexota bacterium]
MTQSTMSGTGTATRRWDEYQDTFKQDWRGRCGDSKPWDTHMHAYRYGWESAQHERWHGKDWQHAESDMKAGWHDWNSKHMHGSDMRNEHKDHSLGAHKTMEGKVEHVWDNFKDTVKEGWDRARMM